MIAVADRQPAAVLIALGGVRRDIGVLYRFIELAAGAVTCGLAG